MNMISSNLNDLAIITFGITVGILLQSNCNQSTLIFQHLLFQQLMVIVFVTFIGPMSNFLFYKTGPYKPQKIVVHNLFSNNGLCVFQY